MHLAAREGDTASPDTGRLQFVKNRLIIEEKIVLHGVTRYAYHRAILTIRYTVVAVVKNKKISVGFNAVSGRRFGVVSGCRVGVFCLE